MPVEGGAGSVSGFVTRWRNPALARICFLIAICCFNFASKLGCSCAHGDSDVANFNSRNFKDVH